MRAPGIYPTKSLQGLLIAFVLRPISASYKLDSGLFLLYILRFLTKNAYVFGPEDIGSKILYNPDQSLPSSYLVKGYVDCEE